MRDSLPKNQKQLSHWKTFIIFFFLLISSHLTFAQFKVIGYLPTWGGNLADVQYTKLTHINYAFLIPTASGGYEKPDDPTRLKNLVSQAHANNVKVIISVGGGGGGNAFKTIVKSASLRTTFVNNMLAFVNQYNLDGVDIDWEFPSNGTEANNFALMMKELYAKMHTNGKLCTAAVIAYDGTSFVNDVFNSVDFLNIMAYDENSYEHSTYDLGVKSINYWVNRGLPKSKAMLGVPFYARDKRYDYKTVDYSAILAMGGSPNADTYNNLYGYNGIPTMKKKTAYALTGACGGIMIWSIDTDAKGANSLLSAINQVVVGTAPINVAPTVSLTAPVANASYTAPASITINAAAADADGTVSKVDFYNGSTLLGSDATSPYSYIWTSVAAGTYSLTAKATDNKGATKTTAALSVTVTTPTLPIKEYMVNKTVSAITVDGVLNEAGWVNAPATDNLINMNGTAATQIANAKMLWSDSYLYFAFTIQDNSMWSTLTARDAELYTQDVLEVLIDKDGDGLNYTEIGFAPNGTLYDLVMNKPYSAGGTANTAWNIANLQVKTKVTGTINTATGGVQWVVEAALPFSGIPATPATFGKPNAGDTWRLNFARADHNYNAATSEKLYTWTYTDGVTNHLPSRFGKVTFGNAIGNVAPTVSITSPANNASFTAPATVTINANAADADGTVNKVDFYNGTTLLGTDASAPYTVSWTNVAAGNYSITAKATDNTGAVTSSTAVSVIVQTIDTPPNVAPSVSLTSPLANASFNAPASISMAATAADADGTVSKVDFYNGTTLLISDATSPYSYTWTSVSAGTYSITAKATDNKGAVTTSAVVTVKVNTIATTDPCANVAAFIENGNYTAGSKVKNAGKEYQCKPYPYSGWCNGAAWAYGPGTGSYWTDAWTLVGTCTANAKMTEASTNDATLTNFPNPFSALTTIEIIVEQAGDVEVKVYDKTGVVVGTVAEGYMSTGTYNFSFDASHLNADVYLIKFNTSNQVFTRKMIKTN